MVYVKHYDLATGHVETLKQAETKEQAEIYLATIDTCLHGADDILYLDFDPLDYR